MAYRIGSASADVSGDFEHFEIKRVSVDESGRWLAAAWRDIVTSPGASLSYGAVVVVLSYLITFGLTRAGLGSLILPLAAGFMLVGPLAAMGLYEISRRHAAGQPASLGDALAAWGRNSSQTSIVGLALMLVFFVWIQLALIIFALFYSGSPPPLERFVNEVLFSLDAVPFLMVGTLVGGVLATIVFTISAVSLPMLLDRDVSAVTAIVTSVAAVRTNWRVMIGWAAMIVLITACGIATFYIGLAIALPLVGHASWHAYKAMVE